MIQRLSRSYAAMLKRDDGLYVLFTDHEADKAEAVADAVAVEREKTAAMEAEYTAHADCAVCGRPILGSRVKWIHAGMETSHQARPIELRDSGGTDE